jgi:hypothetical protein
VAGLLVALPPLVVHIPPRSSGRARTGRRRRRGPCRRQPRARAAGRIRGPWPVSAEAVAPLPLTSDRVATGGTVSALLIRRSDGRTPPADASAARSEWPFVAGGPCVSRLRQIPSLA